LLTHCIGSALFPKSKPKTMPIASAAKMRKYNGTERYIESTPPAGDFLPLSSSCGFSSIVAAAIITYRNLAWRQCTFCFFLVPAVIAIILNEFLMLGLSDLTPNLGSKKVDLSEVNQRLRIWRF